MTILFLDDDPKRAAIAHQRMSPEDAASTIWSTTAEEAIAVLTDYRVDLHTVYLDHDLGDTQFQDSRSEISGMEVIRWLEKQRVVDWAHCKFIVHSWNIDAGQRMVERLTYKGFNAKQQPFGT